MGSLRTVALWSALVGVASAAAIPFAAADGTPAAATMAPSIPVRATLVPTIVNTGDCVADRVTLGYLPERAPFDDAYCRAGNPDDAAAYGVCLRNSLRNDTSFFTDRCGDGSEYFLSVDGVEHRLQRVGPRWAGVNLAGRFAGDGIELEVLPLQPLGAEPPEEDPDAAPSGAWSVRVTIRRGADLRILEATLTYGP